MCALAKLKKIYIYYTLYFGKKKKETPNVPRGIDHNCNEVTVLLLSFLFYNNNCILLLYSHDVICTLLQYIR